MSPTTAVQENRSGRIGPNAVTRLAEALPPLVGCAATRHLFELAGMAGYLSHPPDRMVDEREVARLHRAVRSSLDREFAEAAARSAGGLTADYLLANRIPRPIQFILRHLPARLAARLLLGAIARHAWTFCGTGRLEVTTGPPVCLEIIGNPFCRDLASATPACVYHAAVFERLFVTLVHPGARVIETRCEAAGGTSCRFEIAW